MLTLNEWTFVATTFAYRRSSTGANSRTICHSIFGSQAKETIGGGTMITSPPDLTGYRMRLGAGASSVSFRGELANINFYSPGAIIHPSI